VLRRAVAGDGRDPVGDLPDRKLTDRPHTLFTAAWHSAVPADLPRRTFPVSSDSPADRYHRRRRAPILIVLLVLLVGGGIAWFQVLKPVPAASTSCNQPGPPLVTTTSKPPTSAGASGTARPTGTARTTARPTPTTTPIVTSLGRFASHDSLTGVRPADPAVVTLQVYNASETPGQAKTLTNELRADGFTSILGGANDPLYPRNDLVCTAQIRYGQAGTTAARTLLIVQPCAQLVLDDRISDSVDLAVGARYDYQPLSAAVKAQLKAIHDAAIPPAVIEGQTAAARPQPAIPPLPSTAGCD
jgi:hypothetical protein